MSQNKLFVVISRWLCFIIATRDPWYGQVMLYGYRCVDMAIFPFTNTVTVPYIARTSEETHIWHESPYGIQLRARLIFPILPSWSLGDILSCLYMSAWIVRRMRLCRYLGTTSLRFRIWLTNCLSLPNTVITACVNRNSRASLYTGTLFKFSSILFTSSSWNK